MRDRRGTGSGELKGENIRYFSHKHQSSLGHRRGNSKVGAVPTGLLQNPQNPQAHIWYVIWVCVFV